MKKSQLKNGMTIKTRNGSCGIILGDKIISLDGLLLKFDELREDLLCFDSFGDDDYDIVAVYDNKYVSLDLEENIEDNTLLWERDERDEIKLEETNFTRHYNTLSRLVSEEETVALHNSTPCSCERVSCEYCEFNKSDSNCKDNFIKWLFNEE